MKYLFYKFYRGALYIRKEGDPDIRAWFVLSGFMGINFYSIQQLCVSLIYKNKGHLPVTIQIIAVLLILTINYFLFLYRDNPQKIVSKYSNESKQSRVSGILVTYLYVIATIVLMMYAKHLKFN